MELNAKQRAALTAICDTFAPGDGAAIPSASALGAVEIVEAMAMHNPRQAESKQLATLLGLWDSPVTGLVLGLGPRRFSHASQEQREKALIALGDSRMPQKRALFQALKGAATLAYYLAPGADGHSPLWSAMDYPGPLGLRTDAAPPPLSPTTPGRDLELACDVVVVGSGAGGGTAAAVLASAGHDVIVVEKGQYYDDGDFDGGELKGLTSLYASGPVGTAEGQLSILSAECLGGGTVVNYTTSFKTPDHVREEWAALGAAQFATDEYDRSLEAVWDRLGVNRNHGSISARDVILERGLTRLGWHVDEMPRNVKGCDNGIECGRCGMGCRIGAKQSTAKTWLVDAERAGARLITGVDVRTVTRAGDLATGVEGVTADGHRVVVRARAVVAAGGSLQTPALLRRSGLTNPNIGRHLRMHPATAVWGEFEDEVRPWEGGIQTRYSNELADLDGSGYGVIYETAATNPALGVAFMAWRGADTHRERMLNLAHLSGVGVITRDQDSGEVKVGKDGEPTVHYALSARDEARLRQGVAGAARIVEAAGALSMFSGHQAGFTWKRGTESVDDFIARCDASGYGPGRCAMAALHLMGSVRMGGSADTSAVDPDGASWEIPNLVVADASCFPTASGVNPMISIEAIAHMNATRLAARL
ncbi:FAD-binding protein [Mumia zhuanghuii]|uniref:GMC family oxidoreductase N-terminal domain-containing protein n=2 Tax=Mumia TaxID=1546255 RepID=A0ABW1QUD3_9ACTN|nr:MULTISPECIES: GMC family oxidoreductase N-terminal domain-containing protein [Mumia]KAA1422968.1 FAD-binding protein [Mumia zhuanghuii]